ncbi:MAG: sugar phosphate isomerase/epimerase [Armatimonadetes bacterium]|nr:sugar phosphate isomerase/epimerase [Armatimonadota bacterium]
MKISVMLGNLRRPLDEALGILADMGVPGVHFSCYGEYDSRTSSLATRRALVDKVKRYGLEISAISVWGGEVDLGVADKHAENIAWAKANLEMSVDLEGPIWQGHAGIMPMEESDPRWPLFVDAMGEIAAHGEKVGACLAIETGPEPAYVMERLMKTIDSPGLRVNYDPANLILWPALKITHGWGAEGPYDKDWAIRTYEPSEGASRLAPYTVHTHAKDALVLPDGKAKEVPLGEGWVAWPRYLRLLKDGGFDGYLAVERETGEDPIGDVRRAVEFLRGQIAALG